MRTEQAAALLTELLRRTHLSAPDDLARIVAEEARRAGADDLDLYLVDYETTCLRPVPKSPGDVREPVPVVGTLAGKAYSSTTIHESGDTGDDRRRL